MVTVRFVTSLGANLHPDWRRNYPYQCKHEGLTLCRCDDKRCNLVFSFFFFFDTHNLPLCSLAANHLNSPGATIITSPFYHEFITLLLRSVLYLSRHLSFLLTSEKPGLFKINISTMSLNMRRSCWLVVPSIVIHGRQTAE